MTRALAIFATASLSASLLVAALGARAEVAVAAVACATPQPATSVQPKPPGVGVTPPADSVTPPPNLPTPPANLPTAPPVTSTPTPLPVVSAPPCPQSVQDAIIQAAQALRGMNTCGLHGASGDEACMASVNQVLLQARLAPLGSGEYGSNYIPSAVLPGVSSGRLMPIAQSQTVPGDIEVRHSPGDAYTSIAGDEHIAVCLTYGCTQVLSNHSSTCQFSWQSSPDMCYVGSPYCQGYSDFYRVLS